MTYYYIPFVFSFLLLFGLKYLNTNIPLSDHNGNTNMPMFSWYDVFCEPF